MYASASTVAIMFGMIEREIALTRRILRGLELRELPELIGRKLVARDADELLASDELLALLNLEGHGAHDLMDIERTLVAHRFVDLRFRLTRWPPAEHQTGGSAVRALLSEPSFSRGTEDEEACEVRLQILQDVCLEIDVEDWELRVFAKAQGLPELSLRRRFEINTGRASRDFPLFPLELEIADAYITNAPTAGLGRNFYL